MDVLNAAFLARAQFAFTVSFHIIFPALTIGLASWLAIIEWRFLKTKNPVYKEVYRMWVKIFAVCFGMGVVSGVVMSYQFGTNWSVFSDKVGNVIGPLLGYEVLTAFFLESSFLGIMLFGWNRVSQRMHFISTVIVAVGTLVSSFWILAANSWMQTPRGFRIGENGIFYPTNWFEVVFTPYFPYQFAHMVTAAYLCAAFAVGGVGAYYLYKRKHVTHARIMLGMSLLLSSIIAPMQILIGHAHGKQTLEHQPIKLAAMEGNWERGTHKPLYLMGMPNAKRERTDYAVSLPGMASWIITGSTQGELPGLKDVPASERPNVPVVFWSFRLMVGIGMLMALTSLIGVILFVRKRLFDTAWFHKLCILMGPSGLLALLAGWFVTEVGRQPYIVHQVMRTGQTVSPIVSEQVGLSLLIFVVVYLFVFGAGVHYVFKLIRKGPQKLNETQEEYYDHSRAAAVMKSQAERVSS